MWIFGLVLLAIAIGLVFAARSKRQRLGLILSTNVCTVGHLRELAESMASGLGPGALRFPAGVVGKVRSGTPLISELAEVDSVYFSNHVRHEKEEPATQGDSKQGPRRTSDQVTQQTKHTDFEIVDDTGSLQVTSEGARWITDTVLSRFEPAGQAPRRLDVGRLSFDMPAAGSGDSKTLGYRFHEEVVQADRDVFVLGHVTDPGGELQISSPEKGEELLISVKGRDQLIREMGSGSKGLTIGAIVCGVLGLLLLL